MLEGERRAQGSDGMSQSCLVQRDRIEVAFDDDHGLRARHSFPRRVQGKKRLPFLEQRGIRRVEIFGSAFTENTPPKSYDSFAQIRDGKHHATAKPIIESAAVIPSNGQTG